jgi:two-component system chemotaxis response regulator CheB
VTTRVVVVTGSGFVAAVIRRALARTPRLELWRDHRDAATALAAAREPTHLLVVDAELLADGGDGAALRRELVVRRGPTVLIDARNRGGLDDLAAVPAVRGARDGELDLAAIESELPAAVATALRRTSSAVIAAVQTAPVPRADLHDAVLDLIVLGVSTGGPSLLLHMLKGLAAPAIPMLIVQHMPASETAGFAARLGEESGLDFREVGAGPLPPAGTIGVVRGGSDVRIVRRQSGLHLRDAVVAGSLFHPSVDEVLLSALAAEVAVGAVILTGMGQDGAAGALAMARKGLPVVAQRPDTCAVAGMPQAAIDNGAARAVQSPEAIAGTLGRWSENVRRAAPVGGCLP